MNALIKQKVLDSFNQQKIMSTIGASIHDIDTGRVEILLPFNEMLTQQHGFLHAGIAATIMDSACGYAALSTMPPEAGVLSVEFKVNLLAPANGDRFKAVGTVIKQGKTIIVTQGELFSLAGKENQENKLVATMTATIMTILGRENITH